MIEKTTQMVDDLIVRILNDLLSKIKTKEDIELYKENTLMMIFLTL